MITIPGTIPIRIHPLFWLLAVLIGWLSSNTVQGTVLWTFVIFFSVMFHEFGHALTALAFGQKPNIDLVATGGLTTRSGPPLKLWQEFLVILNGPLAGFILYGILFAIYESLNTSKHPILDRLFQIGLFVNLVWTIINLLPFSPWMVAA